MSTMLTDRQEAGARAVLKVMVVPVERQQRETTVEPAAADLEGAVAALSEPQDRRTAV